MLGESARSHRSAPLARGQLAPPWMEPMQVRLWNEATGTAQLLDFRYRVNQSKLPPANTEGDDGKAGPWQQNPETAGVDKSASVGSRAAPQAGKVDAAAVGVGARRRAKPAPGMRPSRQVNPTSHLPR
jgi:hypothetical protein